MNALSPSCALPAFALIDECIFSQGSAVGTLRCGSPDGPRTCPFGPAHAPASPSRSVPQTGKGWTTSVTCGPSCGTSSPSLTFQQSLESRLLARLAGIGSMEYGLTWKRWVIGSGPQICALRASVPRTSAKGSTGSLTGYPTACANDNPNPIDPDTWTEQKQKRRERTAEAVRAGETK